MTLLIGQRYREKFDAPLTALGADVLWLPDDPDLDERLAGHADLAVVVPRPGTAVVAQGIYPYIVNKLTNRGYTVTQSGPQGESYPAVAGLCVCVVGHYTIYNSKTVDPVLAPLLTGTLIDVPQGFTKCSICVVSEEGIITSDDVIAHRASKAGLDVLHIAPGMIRLEGFDTGFIGGASFLLNSNTLAFTGTLDGHADKDRITAFLRKHGVRPVCLTEEPIFDVGGAVALP